MKPITREEQYLNKLTGEEQSIAEPITREEQYLSRLCGADNIIPQTPETRREAYLAALCGEEVETPEPVTRIEQYMNFAAGKSQRKPEKAITREEMYWDKYQGGAVPEEKTVQGDIIHITDATGDNAVALSVALAPTQDGTPSIDSEPTTKPYLSKVIPRGNKEYYSLVGGTVAWNQLVDSNTTEVPTISGRKYLTVISGTKSIIAGNGTSISVTGGTDNVHDLTLLFANNSAIADYIYSLEQTEAGSGIAWLKSYGFFTKDYYPYNPGELISVKTSGHKTVGFNQWDEVWELGYYGVTTGNKGNANNQIRSKNFIKALPNTRYYRTLGGSSSYICQYDENHNFINTISANPFVSNGKCSYLTITFGTKYGTTYKNDMCFNISDPQKDGTYKPYVANTYSMDPTDLRGLFKLDTANKLYCEGDIYMSDSPITRKYRMVDLGTLDWKYVESYTYPFFSASDSSLFYDGQQCFTLYVDVGSMGGTDFGRISTDKCFSHGKSSNAPYIKIRDNSYTSAESFKTAMNGVYLVCELATPTTETANPYTSPIPIEVGGTEEFIDNRTVPIPVGNETYYASEYAINGFEGVTVHVSETQTGGTIYPVTFTSQGTVYGGTIDVVSGEMSIEYIRKTNPTVWQFDSQNNVAIIKIHSYYLVDSNQPECWSNRYEYKGKTTNLASMPDKSCAIYFSYIAIRDSRFTSAEVAEEMLQGSEFVARITPTISATIDPTEIELNEGENYVWTEEGTTTLTYMAKAAQRVRSMNRTLQKNLNAIELKKGGDVK